MDFYFDWRALVSTSLLIIVLFLIPIAINTLIQYKFIYKRIKIKVDEIEKVIAEYQRESDY
jgi:hypothetical protein